MSIGNKLKIAICGKSGLVGSKLDELFSSQHNDVVGVKIRDNTSIEDVAAQIDKCDILINLSGTTILAPWSDEYKKLYSSRIDTTKKLVDAIAVCKEKPKLFSALLRLEYMNQTVRTEMILRVTRMIFILSLQRLGSGGEAEAFDVRVVQMRFGVIFSKDGGAMSKILPPFKMGVGGKLGRGDQMVSWIHIEDLLRAILFIIKTPAINGSVNFTSPYPISNIEQTYILGEILNRPTFFGVPAFMIKLVFGEGARVILDSKEVYPTKLLENGFAFYYEKFEDALREIVE